MLGIKRVKWHFTNVYRIKLYLEFVSLKKARRNPKRITGGVTGKIKRREPKPIWDR